MCWGRGRRKYSSANLRFTSPSFHSVYPLFHFRVFFAALLLSMLVKIVFEDNCTYSLRERRFSSTKVRPLPQPTPFFCGLKVTFFFKVLCGAMPLFQFQRIFYLLFSESWFPNSSLTSSPISTNGAQYFAAENFSESRRVFMAW